MRILSALTLASCLLLGATSPAAAAEPATPASASTAQELIKAEVRKIDAANQKITLRHEDIPSLQMSGMTMVFHLASPTLAADLKPGDLVQFSVRREGARLLITHLIRQP